MNDSMAKCKYGQRRLYARKRSLHLLLAFSIQDVSELEYNPIGMRPLKIIMRRALGLQEDPIISFSAMLLYDPLFSGIYILLPTSDLDASHRTNRIPMRKQLLQAIS
jgi:hypothetical protein